MKKLFWTAALIVGSALAASAQDSYVFIARGTNAVEVRRANGSLVTTLTGAPYNFNTPWDIVASEAFGTVAVSNSSPPSVTLFDASTFAHIANVPLVNATTARGMSVSGDGRFVFVAVQRLVGPQTFSGVFRIDLADNSPTLAGEVASSFAVEDCVVVNSSAVGGTGGDGPGRVYFSVPGGNTVRVININPAGPIGSIPFGVGAPNLGAPTQLERTPDHSAVFVAGNSNDVATNSQLIGRIQVSGDVLTLPALRTNAIQNLGQVLDIAFRPDGRAYVIGSVDAGATDILEMDVNGVNLGVPPQPAVVGSPGRIRYDGDPQRLYIGETTGTAASYGRANASVQPLGTVNVLTAGGGGPRAFAFAPAPPAPVISDVSPSGMVSAAGTTIEISGSGFDPATVVEFINQAGVPTGRVETFVHSGLIRVNGDGLAPALYDVQITNPDTQTFRLVQYFVSINPPAATPAFQVDVPARTKGYRLRSFPQYYGTSDLFAALQAQFGGYSPSVVRVFVQSGSGYVDLSQLAGSPSDLSGKAFWILSRDGGPLTLSGARVGPPNSIGDRKIVILQPGWNMISMPATNTTNFSMDPNDIGIFEDPALLFSVGSLATTPGVETSFPHVFVDGAYAALNATDPLTAGVGYWLRNNTDRPLYIRFLPSDATLSPAVVDGLRAPVMLGASETPDLPPPPPSAALAGEDGGTSGCGLTGLELLALLALARARGRRRSA